MKLYYPPPLLFNLSNEQINSIRLNSLMIAVDQDKNLVCVQEIIYPSVWISFWSQYHNNVPLDRIQISISENLDNMSILKMGDQIIQGLRYIMARGYIFLGILTFTDQPLDSQILEDWGFFKRRKKYFSNLLINYHKQSKSPIILDQFYINTDFLGVGEKFFSFLHSNQVQIAQLSSYFHGSLHGVVGLKENILNFTILSQNISKQKEQNNLVLDKRGRDILINLMKKQEFLPIAGFEFNYGINSLFSLSFHGNIIWKAVEMLPQYAKPVRLYQQYLQAMIFEKPLPVQTIELPAPFLTMIPPEKEEKRKLSPEELLKLEKQSPKPTISNYSAILSAESHEDAKSSSKPTTINESPQSTSLQQENKTTTPLEKISLEKPKLNLSKPIIKEIHKDDSLETGEDYQDIFSPSAEKLQLFDKEGKAIINPDEIDTVLQQYSEEISKESGQLINTSLMSKNEMFEDLEASLKALSQLDELAQEDQAVSRIYYPPLSLISKASKDGMAIGGSTVIVSIGTGKNLWMVPEIKGTQMWGTFYKDSDLSDQFEDFVALQEREIESLEDFEVFLQNAFIRIRNNNHLFLGICDFEANGFERNVFEPELILPPEELQKLMDIHQKKRENMQFPELEKEQWIEIRYFGNSKILQFFTNSNINSVLEIAQNIYGNPVFSKGKIAGIVCLDEEAAYFFILTDNLASLDQESPKFEIDQTTLQNMYQMIDEMNLTPASFWMISFGFDGLRTLEQWEEIKQGIIFPVIKENYEKYFVHLLELKSKEDQIRASAENRFQLNNE
ncbi:MAG: hypothetical protein ACTSX0_03290 [Promethearchaeota archaeon]